MARGLDSKGGVLRGGTHLAEGSRHGGNPAESFVSSRFERCVFAEAQCRLPTAGLWIAVSPPYYFVDMLTTDLKERIEHGLRTAFDFRFVKVLFYGSRARGEEKYQSDLDVLVVLKGPIHLWADVHSAVRALYKIQLELDYSIHILPVDNEAYETGRFALYRQVKREGVGV